MFKRVLISFALGSTFVVTLMVLAIPHFYNKRETDKNFQKTVKIERLSEYETIKLFDQLGIEFDPMPEKPNLNIPNYNPSNSGDSEFVHLLLTINTDGSVLSANVNSDYPQRIYDKQALEQIVNKTYKPKLENGVAVQYQLEEIIELTHQTEK